MGVGHPQKRKNPLKIGDIIYPVDCSPIRVWTLDNQRRRWFTTANPIGSKYFGWVDPASSHPTGIKVFITDINVQLLVIKKDRAFLQVDQAILIDKVTRKSCEGHLIGFRWR